MERMNSLHFFQLPDFMAWAAATTCSRILSGGPVTIKCCIIGTRIRGIECRPPLTNKRLFVVIFQLVMEALGYETSSSFCLSRFRKNGTTSTTKNGGGGEKKTKKNSLSYSNITLLFKKTKHLILYPTHSASVLRLLMGSGDSVQ